LLFQALGQVAKLWPLEDRDSFSSLTSSFLALDHVVRFNIGQESHDEILVRFYAIGRLLSEISTGANAIVASVTLEKVFGVIQSEEILAVSSFDAMVDKWGSPKPQIGKGL
jgi:hypothetical protein